MAEVINYNGPEARFQYDLPTPEQIVSTFMLEDKEVLVIEYQKDYPAVEVLTSRGGHLQDDLMLFRFDRWHGGGFWSRII